MLLTHHYPDASAIDLLTATTSFWLFSPPHDSPRIQKKGFKEISDSLEAFHRQLVDSLIILTPEADSGRFVGLYCFALIAGGIYVICDR